MKKKTLILLSYLLVAVLASTATLAVNAWCYPREMTKLEQLRALDAGGTRRGTAVSLLHGILYTLVLGTGMSCCMVWTERLFLPGILIGCIGLAGVAATYPIYNRIVKQDRERIAPEILRLTEELAFGE